MPVSLCDELVTANRILAAHSVVDAFGHVNVRMDEETFLLSRSMAPALVTAADVMRFGFDGEAVDGDQRKPFLERFIHAEIYRRRLDIRAVVHSHAPAVIPFTVTDVPLRPMYHMAGFLGGGAARFDIADVFGATDMLVRTAAHGVALAEALANATVVLMRGHGCVVVADGLRLAVFRAVTLSANCTIQQQAYAMGPPITALSAEEATLADFANSAQTDRAWELWTAGDDTHR